MHVPSWLHGNGLCWLVQAGALPEPRPGFLGWKRGASVSLGAQLYCWHNIYGLAVKDSVVCGPLKNRIPDLVSVSLAIPGNPCLWHWMCSAVGTVRSSGFLQGVQHGGFCPDTAFSLWGCPLNMGQPATSPGGCHQLYVENRSIITPFLLHN